jgi:putative transposase
MNDDINMVIEMKSAYRYRAYPSREQKTILNRQMYLAKNLYNLLLEKSQQHFKDTGKTFTKYDMNKWITKAKKENEEYDELYSQVLQNISDRISKAYKNFFRRVKENHNGKKQRVGFPRFKTFVCSLTYPQLGFKIEKKKVNLSKVGCINFVNHREIEGGVKTCTIKKTKAGEWFVTITVEQEDKPFVSNHKEKIGLDLGLLAYATLSDGTKIPNQRPEKKLSKRLRQLHQRVSSKKLGGKNRRKAVKRLAVLSDFITNQRDDYLHKISHNLVNSYSFIAYEKLQVANMAKNHRLARSIEDASWAKFVSFLVYKAESAGCRVREVNPRNTTRMCSGCGNVQDIELDERIYLCQKCGLKTDRDINAAINIRTAGLVGTQAFGDNVRPQQEAIADELGTKQVAFR